MTIGSTDHFGSLRSYLAQDVVTGMCLSKLQMIVTIPVPMYVTGYVGDTVHMFIMQGLESKT